MNDDSGAALIAEGRDLLARERALLLAGSYAEYGALAEEKSDFLERLERVWPGLERVGELRRGLLALIEDARRNEALLSAARAGISAARRRIAAVKATHAGAVAYARDGSRIASRADACGKSRCA